MRLTLIDRIVDLKPDFIKATKSLTLSEDYLRDHFPRFPVMPGVLMLESMYQTAAWLIRVKDEFAHSMVLLSEAKNVKFSDFVAPGQTLEISAELLKQDERFATLKCHGEIDGKIALRGRLVLESYNLADSNARDAVRDTHITNKLIQKFKLLYPDQNSETK